MAPTWGGPGLLLMTWVHNENRQGEIIKHPDDAVMIENLVCKSENKVCFKSGGLENCMYCKYKKMKFVVFEKILVKRPNVVFGDLEISSCESYKHLIIHFDKQMNLGEHINNATVEL